MLNRIYHSNISGQMAETQICGILGSTLDQAVSYKIDGIIFDIMISLYVVPRKTLVRWMEAHAN